MDMKQELIRYMLEHPEDTNAPLVLADWLEDQGDYINQQIGQLLRSTSILFALVPKGTFWMSEDDQNAQRQVNIPHNFYLGVFTVTQKQWRTVMGSNPSWFSRTGNGKDVVKDISDAELDLFPVERVSWDDVQEFLKKLNERERNRRWLYRLPTEAEWEYACRGGASSKEDCSFNFYFDKPTNDLDSTMANFNGNNPAGNGSKGPYLARPTKVGSYKPNRLGLYDLHGNVWEWCTDQWKIGASARVLRGGSWLYFGRFCRSAIRFRHEPDNRNFNYGFRLAAVKSKS